MAGDRGGAIVGRRRKGREWGTVGTRTPEDDL